MHCALLFLPPGAFPMFPYGARVRLDLLVDLERFSQPPDLFLDFHDLLSFFVTSTSLDVAWFVGTSTVWYDSFLPFRKIYLSAVQRS